MRFARADGTIQTGLLENLLRKDDTLNKVERTKKSLRALLLGGKPELKSFALSGGLVKYIFRMFMHDIRRIVD